MSVDDSMHSFNLRHPSFSPSSSHGVSSAEPSPQISSPRVPFNVSAASHLQKQNHTAPSPWDPDVRKQKRTSKNTR